MLQFIPASLGNLEILHEYWNWVGPCALCGRILKGMLGVFCANFAYLQKPWMACCQAWCGSCYMPHPRDKFFQLQPLDESRYDWWPKKDVLCFHVTRNGHHLMVPFRCNLCCFHNIHKRNPNPVAPQDQFILCCIWHADLDAMWGREPLMIPATLWGALQMVVLWHLTHTPIALPEWGPFQWQTHLACKWPLSC